MASCLRSVWRRWRCLKEGIFLGSWTNSYSGEHHYASWTSDGWGTIGSVQEMLKYKSLQFYPQQWCCWQNTHTHWKWVQGMLASYLPGLLCHAYLCTCNRCVCGQPYSPPAPPWMKAINYSREQRRSWLEKKRKDTTIQLHFQVASLPCCWRYFTQLLLLLACLGDLK